MTTEEFLLSAMSTISKEYHDARAHTEFQVGLLVAVKAMLNLKSADEAHELLTITEQISRQSREQMRAVVRPGHIVIIDHKERRTEHRFAFLLSEAETAKFAIKLHNDEVQ